MSRITRVGLTGGVASGKSVVAKWLSDLGVLVVDMDLLSKTLLDSDSHLQTQVIDLFGKSIITDDKIDRKKLRKAVFESPQKKAELEALIHPRVRKQFDELAQRAQDEGRKVIVCEAALLLESGYGSTLDQIIVVLAPLKARIERLMARDSISEDLALKMIQAQTTDDERRKRASYLIENDSTLQELRGKTEALLKEWRTKEMLF
jgi:dephospho-CoA kinase